MYNLCITEIYRCEAIFVLPAISGIHSIYLSGIYISGILKELFWAQFYL